MLGKHQLDIIDGHEHVGTMLSPSDKVVTEYVKKRVNNNKKPGHAILCIGSKHAIVTPVTGSKLYWSVCVSKVCYGPEVMNINREVMDVIE